MSNRFRTRFVELNARGRTEPVGALMDWIDFIKHEGEKDMTCLVKSSSGISETRRAFKEFEKDSRLKEYRRARWESRRAEEDALFDARNKGMEEGMQKGREEEREKFRKKTLRTAGKMLARGFSAEEIADLTGFSVAGVKKSEEG